MSILADWISDNQYWLKMAGHILALLGIVLTTFSGVRIVRALRKAGNSVGGIVLMTLAPLVQAVPFVIGVGLYYVNEHTGVLNWLIPETREQATMMSRAEAIWELIRWIPFCLLVFMLTGGVFILLESLTDFYTEQRKRLASYVHISTDKLVNNIGIFFTIAGVLVHLAVDAVVSKT